ncbi:MAG TPA: uroporphyrinogen decarboxylase [Candidatus Limnocylindrales bacterium]|nr:uroporphyrinogen decarboxylase [Candidatus Limnocylindrales bacterium]
MNHRFLKACKREVVDCTPVWFMRQAGRYMAEYRAIRQKYTLLTICKTPELAAQVTLQPIEKLGVDAAIIFADILLPVEGMGIQLEFAQGEGPVIRNPIRDKAAVEALRPIEPEEMVPFTLEAIRIVRRELNNRIPLIGFAGAPFTLASYLIEGGHSRDYVLTKSMMYKDPETWRSLMTKLAKVVTAYLQSQIRAGAQAVQLFDSWIGCLSPGDYREYVLPFSRQIIQNLKRENVPIIHFGTGTAALLELMREAGSDVIGVDWRVNIDEAWNRLGNHIAIQGNLDPVALFAPLPELKKRIKEILQRVGNRPGHIFNLGHGILPQTPVENVIATVQMVHELSQR